MRFAGVPAAAVVFGWSQVPTPFLERLEKEGRTNLQVHRDGNLVRAYTIRGEQDLLLRASGSAPLVLRGIDLPGGEHDLGALEPDPGATIRIPLSKAQQRGGLACTATWLACDIAVANDSWEGEEALWDLVYDEEGEDGEWRRVRSDRRAPSHLELPFVPRGRIRLCFSLASETWTQECVSTGAGVIEVHAEPKGADPE